MTEGGDTDFSQREEQCVNVEFRVGYLYEDMFSSREELLEGIDGITADLTDMIGKKITAEDIMLVGTDNECTLFLPLDPRTYTDRKEAEAAERELQKHYVGRLTLFIAMMPVSSAVAMG
jgi:hypothetical protein